MLVPGKRRDGRASLPADFLSSRLRMLRSRQAGRLPPRELQIEPTQGFNLTGICADLGHMSAVRFLLECAKHLCCFCALIAFSS